MGIIRKEIAIGFVVSLFATLCGMFIYLEYISDTNSLSETIRKIKEGGVLGTVIALSAIPNLFVFFIFLKKNQDYRARGVLLGTIFIALLTLVIKFI
ncbi:hypothetical protein [uncultured Tenacibaculum sp.]|uniref:hypothetical protein n=1 Tax=uncultured Tenacibaculum sp. TaxID=174713 RepID=UPI0026104CB6|nr:hypothetical protein [uncultured Tenacibaculum sp.]